MAYELRRLVNNLSGTLSARVSTTDSQITCQGSAPGVANVFATLPTDFSNGSYMPLVLANESTGKFEIVWVVGHASASPTLTVIRAREGTDQQTFEVGDVVRCAATERDLTTDYANRAALPSDPHVGMRALLLDQAAVVERTSTGWNDAVTLKDDPKRKHRWSQAGASTQAGSGQTISGLSGAQVATTGNLATVTAGQALLNEPGDWFLQLAMFAASGSNRNQGLGFLWPNGAFPGSPNRYDYRGFFGGAGINGNGLVLLEWEGYVPSAAAAAPITLEAFTTVALTGAQYDFFAEYKGR